MTTKRTWYTFNDLELGAYDVSSISKRNASAFWALKAALLQQSFGPNVGPNGAAPVGAKWTCVGSSDGTTAGLDGVDRWGTSFDTSKLVINNPGSPHSWILLRSPSTGWSSPVYMLLSLSVISTLGLVGRISKDAWVGGNASNDPTSTNSRNNNPLDGYLQLANPASSAVRLHFTTDQYGHFFCLLSTNGTVGSIYSCIAFAEAENLKSNDTDAWVYLQFSGLLAYNNFPLIWCLFNSSWHLMSINYLVGRSIATVASSTTVNSQGESDSIPLFVGYPPGSNFGTGVSGGTSLERGLKGNLVDCFMGFSLPCLTSYPASGNMEALSLGDGIWLPFTRVPTF